MYPGKGKCVPATASFSSTFLLFTITYTRLVYYNGKSAKESQFYLRHLH